MQTISAAMPNPIAIGLMDASSVPTVDQWCCVRSDRSICDERGALPRRPTGANREPDFKAARIWNALVEAVMERAVSAQISG